MRQQQKAGSLLLGLVAVCWNSLMSFSFLFFSFQFIYILKRPKNIQGVLVTLPSNLCGRVITCHSRLHFKAEESGLIFFWHQTENWSLCLATVLLFHHLNSKWCHQPLYQKWDIISIRQHDSRLWHIRRLPPLCTGFIICVPFIKKYCRKL